MIAFLEGVLDYVHAHSIFLAVQGIGYEVFVQKPQAFQSQQHYRLYTCPIYREDNQQLYGFITPEERNCFKLLVEKVSGIGPKLALTLLTVFSMHELCSLIVNQDYQALTRCPGVGKKTAQRLLLELHDYLKALPASTPTDAPHTCYKDAIDALIVLGYPRKQSEERIQKVHEKHPELDSVEAILRQALQS